LTNQEHILIGGGTDQYRKMYELALIAMKETIFYTPMVQHPDKILFPGQFRATAARPHFNQNAGLQHEAQHLGCFAGGMVGLASKALNKPQDMEIARALVEGCLWAYEQAPQGIMPEVIHLTPCPQSGECVWNETLWLDEVQFTHDVSDLPAVVAAKLGLAAGVTKVDDAGYLLRYYTCYYNGVADLARPEAIESVFILYRLTGDETLPNRAWHMFNSIVAKTKTDIAHASLLDCTRSSDTRFDRMESFWLAETLKYFYLMFSEPDVLSLDEYVFNTEAHPLKRPSGK
jgi:mannosyl-oligosaccharide alpha-1,2-mannosidase